MRAISADTLLLESLVGRWRRGDRTAREELLRRASGRLERLTRKMLHGFHGVQRWEQTGDVLQNALMRLWKALQAVTPDSLQHFLSLAALQIRRELLDLRRHYFGPQGIGANHATQAGESASRSARHGEVEDAARMSPATEWLQFHELIDQLPPHEREMVDLLIYHEFKQSEAAALLKVTVRTVQNRYAAALVRLRQLLKYDQT